MKKGDDLPLLRFDFRPPPCSVIVFPLGKRIGKARHVAQKLQAMAEPTKEKARESYWRERCKDLTAELQKRGLTPDQIKTEIFAFRDVVELEMRKAAARSKQSPRPSAWDDDGPRRA